MKNKFVKIHDEYSVAPLTQLMNFGYPSIQMQKILNYPKVNMACLYRGFTVAIYFIKKEWVGSGKQVIKIVAQSTKTINWLLGKSEKVKKDALHILRNLKWNKIEKYSHKELYQLLKQLVYQGFLLSAYSQPGAMADHWHYSFSKRLEKEIQSKSNFKKKQLSLSEIISTLNLPTKPYPSDFAKQELLKLQKKIRKQSQNKKILLNNFLNKWFWTSFGQMGPGLSQKELNTELKRRIDLTDFKSIVKKQQAIKKSLRLNQEQKNLFYAASNFIYLKGARVEICNGVCAFIHKLIKKISRETGIMKKLLFFCSISEVLKYLKTGEITRVKTLTERSRFSVWLADNAFDVKILVGRAAKNFIKSRTYTQESLINKTTEIKGNVAFAGVVCGTAKIINLPQHMVKMREGDVLVSIQTTPELLPAMKKAVAFVTDIGGIISHAALVAREFKIPCIVGTKIATKVLKDGDRVEVDATKGLVRKLD
ncbi:MAG: PEP-utilizing enzyme [Patescibacteria group bacterium]